MPVESGVRVVKTDLAPLWEAKAGLGLTAVT